MSKSSIKKIKKNKKKQHYTDYLKTACRWQKESYRLNILYLCFRTLSWIRQTFKINIVKVTKIDPWPRWQAGTTPLGSRSDRHQHAPRITSSLLSRSCRLTGWGSMSNNNKELICNYLQRIKSCPRGHSRRAHTNTHALTRHPRTWIHYMHNLQLYLKQTTMHWGLWSRKTVEKGKHGVSIVLGEEVF